MIKSFKCADTEKLFYDVLVARFRSIERPVHRKLIYLHRARTLGDLKQPPGNRLEALKGGRRMRPPHQAEKFAELRCQIGTST